MDNELERLLRHREISEWIGMIISAALIIVTVVMIGFGVVDVTSMVLPILVHITFIIWMIARKISRQE